MNHILDENGNHQRNRISSSQLAGATFSSIEKEALNHESRRRRRFMKSSGNFGGWKRRRWGSRLTYLAADWTKWQAGWCSREGGGGGGGTARDWEATTTKTDQLIRDTPLPTDPPERREGRKVQLFSLLEWLTFAVDIHSVVWHGFWRFFVISSLEFVAHAERCSQSHNFQRLRNTSNITK